MSVKLEASDRRVLGRSLHTFGSFLSLELLPTFAVVDLCV